jgi:hypothetical protein
VDAGASRWRLTHVHAALALFPPLSARGNKRVQRAAPRAPRRARARHARA